MVDITERCIICIISRVPYVKPEKCIMDIQSRCLIGIVKG